MSTLKIELEVEFPDGTPEEDPSVSYVRNYIATTMNGMLSDLNFNVNSTLVVQNEYEET